MFCLAADRDDRRRNRPVIHGRAGGRMQSFHNHFQDFKTPLPCGRRAKHVIVEQVDQRVLTIIPGAYRYFGNVLNRESASYTDLIQILISTCSQHIATLSTSRVKGHRVTSVQTSVTSLGIIRILRVHSFRDRWSLVASKPDQVSSLVEEAASRLLPSR